MAVMITGKQSTLFCLAVIAIATLNPFDFGIKETGLDRKIPTPSHNRMVRVAGTRTNWRVAALALAIPVRTARRGIGR